MAELHEELIRDLAGSIVLVDLLIHLQNGLISGEGLLQLGLELLFLCKHVLICFLCQQLGKALLVGPQALSDLPQLQLHNFFNGIRTYILGLQYWGERIRQ